MGMPTEVPVPRKVNVRDKDMPSHFYRVCPEKVLIIVPFFHISRQPTVDTRSRVA